MKKFLSSFCKRKAYRVLWASDVTVIKCNDVELFWGWLYLSEQSVRQKSWVWSFRTFGSSFIWWGLRQISREANPWNTHNCWWNHNCASSRGKRFVKQCAWWPNSTTTKSSIFYSICTRIQRTSKKWYVASATHSCPSKFLSNSDSNTGEVQRNLRC